MWGFRFLIVLEGSATETPVRDIGAPLPFMRCPGCRGDSGGPLRLRRRRDCSRPRPCARCYPRTRPGQDVRQRLHAWAVRRMGALTGARDRAMAPRPSDIPSLPGERRAFTSGRPRDSSSSAGRIGVGSPSGALGPRRVCSCSSPDAISLPHPSPPLDSRLLGNNEGVWGLE